LADCRKSVAVDSIFGNKYYNSPIIFHQLGIGELWYITNTKRGKEYHLANMDYKSEGLAFDLGHLSDALSKLLAMEIKVDSITVDSLSYDKGRLHLSCLTDIPKIVCELGNYNLKILKVREKQKNRRSGFWGDGGEKNSKDSVTSPDQKYMSYIKNYNLYLKKIGTNEESRLSFDGSKGFYYSSRIQWSPDNEKIMAYKVRPRGEHKIYFVESSSKG